MEENSNQTFQVSESISNVSLSTKKTPRIIFSFKGFGLTVANLLLIVVFLIDLIYLYLCYILGLSYDAYRHDPQGIGLAFTIVLGTGIVSTIFSLTICLMIYKRIKLKMIIKIFRLITLFIIIFVPHFILILFSAFYVNQYGYNQSFKENIPEYIAPNNLTLPNNLNPNTGSFYNDVSQRLEEELK